MRILLSLTMIFLVTTSVMSMDKEKDEGKTRKLTPQQTTNEPPGSEVLLEFTKYVTVQGSKELVLKKEVVTARRVPMPSREELMQRLAQVSRLEDVVLEGFQHYDIITLTEKAKKES